MRRNESMFYKRVSIRNLGIFLGSSLIAAAIAGAFWHRRAIIRLIEIRRM